MATSRIIRASSLPCVAVVSRGSGENGASATLVALSLELERYIEASSYSSTYRRTIRCLAREPGHLVA
ncbi:hypothetical protein SAMD00023353_0601260 [Rosellinia necatrix]|uniref:Uncharacterized protein n=1 Tax=Rosellinia necatrix TaxID=77044 RepID=A0A1S8A5T7_ROSNE|nr:hypothetical protein SAMD00023353_0601260 [Rosellinia necatrix]